MNDRHSNLAGTRMLIVGASSGIGRALAVAAQARGATVALAARRIDLLSDLADQLDGSAYELDVSDPQAIESVVQLVAATFGEIDAVVFTSAAAPFALIEDTDVATWLHAYAVNAVGASHVLRAALPHLADDAVVVVASSHDVGRPRAGVAAYHASKAALDEILRSWRAEHPDLAVIRVSVGPTDGTEILRGADRDLLADLYRSWAQEGQIPARMSAVADVANAMLSLIAISRANPTVVSDIVHLAPRNVKSRYADDNRKDHSMDLGFEGATAVVTGGSKGMGLAIAESLGAEGASVAIMARGQSALEAAAEKVRTAGAPAVLPIAVDMADAQSIESAFASVRESWDELNVLVHTVGPSAGAFDDLDDSDWHAAFDFGTMSAVRSVRAALPMLRSAPWARIVTLSAHSIQRQSARLIAYTAVKSALSSLTKNLSKSLGGEGILVNCVCPGTIVTASFTEILKDVLAADGLDSSDPHDVMAWVDKTYGHPCDIGRAGLPEEIASVTTYLASCRNGYVTGATVNVDGGSDFI